jgi:hypothetical protein
MFHFLHLDDTSMDRCSWPEDRIPLLTLLHESWNRLATKHVDKMYATFGMAEVQAAITSFLRSAMYQG